MPNNVLTLWTERTAPVATNWLQAFTMKKDTDNFYKGFSGIIRGLTPTKEASNFYHLAGVIQGSSSTYLLGKIIATNFMETQLR